MGRHSNTRIWEYFDYISDRFAECQTCKARMSTPQKNTYNLKRHLFKIHGINTYLKGNLKDQASDKNDTSSSRRKPKKVSSSIDKSCTVSINNVFSNSISDEANNKCATEDEDNNSISSFHLPIKDNMPENNIYKIDPEDECDVMKNVSKDLNFFFCSFESGM